MDNSGRLNDSAFDTRTRTVWDVTKFLQIGPYTAVQSKKAVRQISNIIDTSIKHPVSGQSTPTVKCCMDIIYV